MLPTISSSRSRVRAISVSRSKLAESADSIANFFAQGFEALGPKLGPILWQFAHFKRFERNDIAAFIDLLPETLDGIRLRHAIEPRHESFADEQFFELCRARNIAVVLDDSDDYPASRRTRPTSLMRGFSA